MQIVKSKKDLDAFIQLCTKYQPFDPRYADLTRSDGVFSAPLVESAFITYLVLVLSAEDSNVKKAYNAWRTYHHGESRRIHIFFNYIDHLFADQVTDSWHTRFDMKDRNMNLSWELICRIFIVWGVVARKAFNQSGKTND